MWRACNYTVVRLVTVGRTVLELVVVTVTVVGLTIVVVLDLVTVERGTTAYIHGIMLAIGRNVFCINL